MARRRIFHVSGDFPDPVDQHKTRAIATLIDLARADFDHEVLSLNRISPAPSRFAAALLAHPLNPRLEVTAQPFAQGTAACYRAPPQGLYHAAMLRQLGDWLTEHLAARPRPDLLVAHKLTIEAIAVRRAAERLGIPYALAIQGRTDVRILTYRPDLHAECARAFHGASMVFPFAPWALREVERRLGTRTGPTRLLPCPTELDQPLVPRVTGGHLLSVFHLLRYKGKNLAGMARAMNLLRTAGEARELQVIGGGTPAELARCQAIVARSPGVRLVGPVDRAGVRMAMNAAAGLVLPSLRESFGLVFVEALFAGLPIVYPAGTSVDGYFDGLPFARKVDARSPAAIAEAMRYLIDNEADLKRHLRDWQQSAHAGQFQRPAIARTFSQGLLQACAADQ